MKSGLQRIGLFGGTFDPVHTGHLRVACEIAERLDLHQVHIMPCSRPPHKHAGSTDARHRFQMVKLAVAGRSRLVASDIELRRSGPSYTIDTVCELLEPRERKAVYTLILGLDAFREIDTWKSYRELFRLIRMAVMIRPGPAGELEIDPVATVAHLLHTRISGDYTYSEAEAGFRHEDFQPVDLFPVTPLAISATKIRGLIQRRCTISFLVPEKVEDYIIEKGLYR